MVLLSRGRRAQSLKTSEECKAIWVPSTKGTIPLTSVGLGSGLRNLLLLPFHPVLTCKEPCWSQWDVSLTLGIRRGACRIWSYGWVLASIFFRDEAHRIRAFAWELQGATALTGGSPTSQGIMHCTSRGQEQMEEGEKCSPESKNHHFEMLWWLQGRAPRTQIHRPACNMEQLWACMCTGENHARSQDPAFPSALPPCVSHFSLILEWFPF